MRARAGVLACVAAAVLLAAGVPLPSQEATGATRLSFTVWPGGKSGRHHVWTLRCAPPGGSLPRARSACSRLLRQRRPFRPVPRHTVCTEIYGGPRLALVTGRFRGRRVHAVFKRTNGCEIARWNRVGFLFPRR